jgi:hypothetical protein
MPKNDHADETMDLWPELQLNDPKHKAVFAQARRYYKLKAERDAMLTDAKKKLDAAQDKLIGLMHEAKLQKFKFRGIVTEVYAGAERVTVKVADDVDDTDEGDGD